jgi:large-conductance mechanosensitive channel
VATAIDFIVIALVVYFGIKFLKLDKLDKKE